MSEAAQRPSRKLLSAAAICLAACGLTLLLLAAVYALRGVWPFGTDNVGYVDTTQFYLPDYYKLWDAMHGGPLNTCWYDGLAQGPAAGLWGLTNPPSLVFLLVPRDHILEGLSLYLAVYMLLIALSASAAVCVRFPGLHPVWKLALSLSYVFSGYVLQYYSNFGWMWPTALFPLLLLGLERLLRDGRYLLYAAVYAYLIYTSVYFTYMATIYIVLFSFGYCLFLLPRERRGDRLLRLGLSTAAAYGLTAYWWFWSSSQLAGTSRFQSNLDSGLMTGFTTWDLTSTRHTVLMLLGMAFAAALLLRALGRQRRLAGRERARRARGLRFFSFLLGALFVPMVFTNIDTAWHFGQYNFFPMRYGFMLPATLLAAAGVCLEEEARLPADGTGRTPRRPILRAAAALGMIALLVLLEPGLSALFREYGSVFLNVLNGREYGLYLLRLAACGLLFTGLYLLLLSGGRRRALPWTAAVLLLCQLGLNAFSLIAPSDDHIYTREYDPAYVDMSDALYGYFSEQDLSPLIRAKNVDNSLNAGYPPIAGISALSSVNADNTALRLGVFRELGYTVNYFRVLDTGGTVFSDMLFGVDIALSAEPLDETLYADTGRTVGGIRIGRTVYPGTVGLMYRAGALDGYLDCLTLPDRLNALYRAFTDEDEPLAYAPDVTLESQGEGVYSYTLSCELDGEALLYMSAEDAVLMNITAGGRTVPVPTYRNTGNTVYPAAFNANLLYLGTFGPGTAEVRFLSAAALDAGQLTVTALDKARLASFRDDAHYDDAVSVAWEGETIRLTLTAEEPDMRLFLPLTASSRWRCAVNGEPAAAEPVMGLLMGLPLRQGENEVVLTRGPSPLSVTPGMLVSLACLLLAAVLLILRRKRPELLRIAPPGWVYAAARVLFAAVFAAAVIFVYAAPALLFLLRGTVIRF